MKVDVALVFVGETATEGIDRKTLELTAHQVQLSKCVCVFVFCVCVFVFCALLCFNIYVKLL